MKNNKRIYLYIALLIVIGITVYVTIKLASL